MIYSDYLVNDAARVFFHVPVINAICPAILCLYCVFNYQLFKHPAATRYVAVCFAAASVS
ncbi:hypothetical protein CCMA1212_004684 [Trichoderma ghanense]|uniref:Uncharacterized protein n=1 Tax=Trichoderma ghanense TaxID=65468 RepID=A0ABY2H4A8_9HYPO